MRRIEYIFTITITLCLFSCVESAHSIRQSNENALKSSEKIGSNQQNQQNQVNDNKPAEIELVKVKPTKSMIWVGNILGGESVAELRKKFSLDNRNLDDNPLYKKGSFVKVDILNCGGYLMSGNAYKRGVYGWEFEADETTIAEDVLDKIAQCDPMSSKDKKREGLLSSSDVFAVAPSEMGRISSKTGKIDTKKIFASLPGKTKKWLDDTKFDSMGFGREVKSDLLLGYDNWADLNGDGNVDVVSLSGICSAKRDSDPDGDGCSLILLRRGRKWKEIGWTSKA